MGGKLLLHLTAGDHVGVEPADDVGGRLGVDLELPQGLAILDSLDGRPDPPHDPQGMSAECNSHAFDAGEFEAHLPDEVVVDERVIPVGEDLGVENGEGVALAREHVLLTRVTVGVGGSSRVAAGARTSHRSRFEGSGRNNKQG